MKKPGFIILILLFFIVSCNNENVTVITGKCPGVKSEYLQLNRVNLDNTVFIDSVRLNRAGKFRIKLEDTEPAFYTLGLSTDEFITVVVKPGDRINLEFKGEKLQNDYEVEGSEESDKVRLLDKKLGETIISLDSLSAEYQEVVEKGDEPDKISEIAQQYNDILNEQRKHNIAFILDNLNKLSAVKALYQRLDENTYVLFQQRDLQYMKLVADSLGKYYPDIALTKSLKDNLKDELNQMYLSRITEAAREIEASDLDANLMDINGKRRKLSDLIQKNYVLLSFWSAESNECIAYNIFLKQMYQLYHREGFEVYHVNLDSDETLWKTAVKFDELPWVNVREDDPSNPLTARIFNVTSLPANYLFDMNGDIIGKDLFGRSLKIKLGQLFD
ncbi:MAG: thioredoxin-like domain-containing protein [Bacteroidales bacterium]|nr:thioredoxin-like domain-containing protein [Bacteroidales bacterium]